MVQRQLADTSAPTLAARVEESTAGAWHVLALDTPVESVVSFRGSICTYPDFASGEDLLQDLTVALLDKGTRHRDRFQIAEALDDRGAQLSFASDGLRVRFSGRSLSRDVADVLALAAEQLREPLFDADEFVKAKAFVAASLRREMENTGAQASGALARLIYRKGHPNQTHQPVDALALLEGFQPDDVIRFFERRFRPTEAVVSFAGDLGELRPERIVQERLGSWPATVIDAPLLPADEVSSAGRAHVPMLDKANSDVRLGQALRIRRHDEDYIPLYVANFVLGGNFSARLMEIIRDQMGLTYGIWSGLHGISTKHSGHWIVGVTLSTENLERGIEATRNVMERFVDDGISSAELAEKQTTIAGSFTVGLATTGGLASSLLYNAERGFDVGYLDHFPELVQAVSLAQANEAIRTHLHMEAVSITSAGPRSPY